MVSRNLPESGLMSARRAGGKAISIPTIRAVGQSARRKLPRGRTAAFSMACLLLLQLAQIAETLHSSPEQAAHHDQRAEEDVAISSQSQQPGDGSQQNRRGGESHACQEKQHARAEVGGVPDAFVVE